MPGREKRTDKENAMSSKTETTVNRLPVPSDSEQDWENEEGRLEGITAGRGVASRDRIQGKWSQIKGKLKETWGALTDDEANRISGVREQLVGKLQAKHGYPRHLAEREVREFESSWNCRSSTGS
jgi:uncharacterized protein YjbJ (UPF0337 family)